MLSFIKANDRYGIALSLREQGCTYRQIGAALGVGPSRAAQIYRRAVRWRDSMNDQHILREWRGEVSDAPAPLPAESPEWKSIRHARLLALYRAANPNFTVGLTQDQIDAKWEADRQAYLAEMDILRAQAEEWLSRSSSSPRQSP